MILSNRVALGGVQLDELHELVVIRSVDPGTPMETINAASRMGGSGQRITGCHFENLEIQVNFAILVPKTEMSLRRQIFNTVIAWAMQKGWLTVNWMPGKRVYVDKVKAPTSGDLWQWTEEFTITFVAYNVPFWQEDTPNQATNTLITSGSLNIDVGGNVQSVLDAEFRNKSGMTINNFWIQANGNRMTLSSLGLGGSETLSINHGTDGILRITAGGRSVLDRRTGADDLYVNLGVTTVSISADRAGQLTVRNYGRYV